MKALHYLKITFLIGILVVSYFLYQEALRSTKLAKQAQQIESVSQELKQEYQLRNLK